MFTSSHSPPRPSLRPMLGSMLLALGLGCTATDGSEDPPGAEGDVSTDGGTSNSDTDAGEDSDTHEDSDTGGDSSDSGDDAPDDSDTGEPLPLPDCPNILSALVSEHGEAQGIAYYQQRFGTHNAADEQPEPTVAPESGHFVSPLSGQSFWQLTDIARTTGASERNHTFFNVDGSRALVRTRSGPYSQLVLVEDLEALPEASPTLTPLPLDGDDPNVEDWPTVAGNRFWHPSDPDRFCWIEGQGVGCYDVVTEQSEILTQFARGPVSVLSDGSDLAGGRMVVYLADQDAGFVYDLEADAVVTTVTEPGPDFGTESLVPVDGVTDEPVFTIVKGPQDVDYVHLTEDGRFTVWVNKDGGNTELRDLSGTLIGIIAEDKNHIEGAWYLDEEGRAQHLSIHVTGASNTKPDAVFEGFTKRQWAGVIYSAEPQPEGTWDYRREPLVLADTTYGNGEFGYNDTVDTQFSAYGDNPYAMAGAGWVDGDLQPTFGVYSIMPRLDARSREQPVDIDRIAYSRLAEKHVGTQAEPVIGPMGDDGSYVVFMRTPFYGTNENDNVLYATRIQPRLRPDWHEAVMQDGQLPIDWSCE